MSDLSTNKTLSTEAKFAANRARIAQIDLILNGLFDHKVEHAKALLTELKLPTNGTIPELRKRLRIALINQDITPARVISMIRVIERWGAQHIYFFKSPEELGEEWDTEAKVLAQLELTDHAELYNENPTWAIPSHTIIESVSFNYPILTVSIVVPRFWTERDKSLDVSEGDSFTLGYKKRSSRAVSTFEWNVVTNHAFLTIPQSKISNYSTQKDELINIIARILKVRSFSLCKLTDAISETLQQEDILIRGLGVEIETGENLTLRSRSKNHDVFENQNLVEVFNSIEGSFQNDGNFYMPRQDDESKKFRCRMHPDHRLSLYNQLNEAEVRHVIAGIQRTF